jgi:hypothetical protein
VINPDDGTLTLLFPGSDLPEQSIPSVTNASQLVRRVARMLVTSKTS